MYESFGAVVSGSTVTFKVFFPDNTVDPTQYTRGGSPQIKRLHVTGTFQSAIGLLDWDHSTAPELIPGPHPKGVLYQATVTGLPDGFYEYYYVVEFLNGTKRLCIDPCSRYDGSRSTHSAFVLGGNDMAVQPIAVRKPLKDLVAYELMIDDFTAEFRGSRAPLDAIWDKLDYLDELGVNAIHFMLWTAWPDDNFSWGYNPYAFFSVEHRYYNDPTAPLDKLFRLKRLIDELHRRGQHVIMDGVFNHVEAGQTPDRGFPYFWLYQDPKDSPYIGPFAWGGYFEDFDFANDCTAEFIVDVCKYWIDEYKIDGIRFDYVRGIFQDGAEPLGIARIVRDLNAYAAAQGIPNLAFTLEFLTDNRYDAIGKTNDIKARGCWYDPFMWQSFDVGRSGKVATSYMRALNSSKDFEHTRVPVTYIENHDHSTLAEQCGGRHRWWRAQPLAIALYTMCGAPLIHNGQEFCDQYGFPESGPGRVLPRSVRWGSSTDGIGTWMRQFYRKLADIRAAHPALRSHNFYPDFYDEQWTHMNPQGYGIDVDRGVAVFHRWGTNDAGDTERFIVAVNFSEYDQQIDIPFPANGRWKELLNGYEVEVTDYWQKWSWIPGNWGRIFWLS